MALDAKEIAVNAAVKALVVAWDDYLDGLAAGTRVTIVPVQGNRNGTAMSNSDVPGLDPANSDTAAQLVKIHYVTRATNSSTDSMIYSLPCELGYLPLFWKVTNSENLLTSA